MTTTLASLGVSIESGSVITRIQAKENAENGRVVKVLLPKALTGEINKDMLDDLIVDGSALDKGKIKIVHEGDVVMKLTTPYDAAYVDDVSENVVVSSHCVTIKFPEGAEVDAKYLAYLLNSPYTKDYLKSVTSGAATVMLKVRDIGNIPIPTLEIGEQRKLGEIFQAFCKKKEILRRMIDAEDAAENALIMDALEGRY